MIGRRALSRTRAYASARTTTLANGVRVVTQATKDPVATVGAYVDAGTRDETQNNEGVSRVIQQMASGSSALKDLGTSLRATFEREQTRFEVKIMPENASIAVQELGRVVAGDFTHFDAAHQQVLNSAEDHIPIEDLIIDRLHMSAFRDVTLGNSVIGPYQHFGNLTSHDADAFVKDTYTADRIVVAAAGNIDHDSLVNEVSRNFAQESKPKASIPEKPYFCGAQMVYRNDDMGPILYFVVGYEGVPWKHPDALVFEVMRSIIGKYKAHAYDEMLPGTLSGNRTINNVANKMNVGCADEFRAFNTFYRDTGLFGVFAACDEIAAENAVGELMFGVNMLSGGVTDEEVERAKRELVMHLYENISGTRSLSNLLGKQMLGWNRVVSPEELSARLQYIDAAEVRRVAWKHLHDQEVSCIALGPAHGFPPQQTLRRNNLMQRY